MENKDRDRYEILRLLATAAAGGQDLHQTAGEALIKAAELVDLQAAAVYLWDEDSRVVLSVAHAEDDELSKRLSALEEDLFRSLRRDRQVVSAYLSFGGERPVHAFTLPLRHGENIFGAVIGLQGGPRTVVAEDLFLDALSAALAVYAVASGKASGRVPQAVIDRERLAAILETAVTVNHEINNPLTAILGNVQLLLLKRGDLDPELKGKLSIIEESATKIKDVTQRLLSLTSARSTEYAEGTRMIDLSDKGKPPDQPDSD
jgi:signal transduction histidine kinase